MVMIMTRPKESVITVKTLGIMSCDILLLKIWISSFPFSEEQTYNISKPKVVVLTPAPVELGEAPINIKIIIKKRVAFCMLPIWMVLKPAVRAVTDWKIEPYIFSPPGDKYLLLIDGMNHGLKRSNHHYSGLPEASEYIKIAMIAFCDAYLKNDEKAKNYLKSDKLEQFSDHTLIFSRK